LGPVSTVTETEGRPLILKGRACKPNVTLKRGGFSAQKNGKKAERSFVGGSGKKEMGAKRGRI